MIDWTQLKTAEQIEAERFEAKANQVRAERDRLLTACDYLALSDVIMPEVWVDYRQALRDVPQQSGFPDFVVWPEVPNE